MGHSSDVLTDLTLQWLDERRDKTKPFFLMHHFKAPHDIFVYAPRYEQYLGDVHIPEPPNLYDQPGQEHFLGTVRRGVEWLDQTPERPFFLFLHSYEVHHPYTPTPEHLALVESDYKGDLPGEISRMFSS